MPPKPARPGFLASFSANPTALPWNSTPTDAPHAEKPKHDRLTVEDFRQLEADFHSGEMQHKDEARRAAAKHRQQRTAELIDAHVFDDAWRAMLHHAQIGGGERPETGPAAALSQPVVPRWRTRDQRGRG